MLHLQNSFRRARVFIALAATLTVCACASQNQQDASAFGPGSAAPGSAQDFVVNVGDRIFFTEDSTTISPEGQATLDKQVMWLRQYPNYTFTVEGHADERGTREYNIALGARRAAAVRDYLTSHGIPAARMKTISYGKERPVAVCNEERCWNQNRRAVIVLNGAS